MQQRISKSVIEQDEELSALLEVLLPMLDQEQRRGLSVLLNEYTAVVKKEDAEFERSLKQISQQYDKRVAHARRIVLMSAIAKSKTTKHYDEKNRKHSKSR